MTPTLKHSSCWIVLLLFTIPACAPYTPRWTPETVPLPASPPAPLAPAPPLEEKAEPVQFGGATEAGKAIPLTRDGALLTALANNGAIQIARLGPEIGATYAPEARGAFDPELLGTVSTGHDTRQQRSGSGTATSSSTGSTSGGGQTQTDPTSQILAQTRQVLTQLQQFIAAAHQNELPVVETRDTNGSLTVQELLPTGTQLFLTGVVSAADTSSTGNDRQGSWTLGINQALLRGAGTSVNLVALRQARNRAARSELAFRAAVLDVVQQVELAYWNLVLADEVLKIREFAVTLADEQLRRNQDLLAVGKAIEGDVMASQAEKASRMADLSDAQAGIRTQTLALIRLLNPDDSQRWRLTFEPVDRPETVPMETNSEASEELALQYRPELAQARLDLANSDLEVLRTKNALLPRLDLTASYGRTSRGDSRSDATRHFDDSDFDNYRLGLDLEVSLTNRAEKARYRRALLTGEQMDRTVADLEMLIATEVRQAAVEVEKQWQRLTASQEAVRSRAEQLRIAEGRNAVGMTTNLDLLIVQRDFIQSQIDEVSARVRYIQALTSLYASEGTLLERRGIFLDAGNDVEAAS